MSHGKASKLKFDIRQEQLHKTGQSTRFHKLLTARITVLLLLLLQLLAILSAALIPQRSHLSPTQLEQWQKAHPWFYNLTSFLGLDHVFGTIWFWIILILFLLSLTNSLIYQLKHTNAQHTGLTWFSRINFRRWGGICLHLGLLITIVAAIIYSTTSQSALLQLYVGEVHTPQDAWDYAESGSLSDDLRLNGSLKLDRINSTLWPSGQLKQITSHLTYTNYGKRKHITLSINNPVSINHIRIYQLHDFGKDFFITLKEKNDIHQLNIHIKYPTQKATWAYGNFNASEIPYEIKAKYNINYLPQSQQTSLVIKLLRKNEFISQIQLTLNESGKLGPYTVTLNDVRDWTAIMAVRSPGMLMIFVGFTLLIIGSLCLYLPIYKSNV